MRARYWTCRWKNFIKEKQIDTEVATVVALMEKHSTNYLLVHDHGKYLGVATIWAIAQRMPDLDR